MELKQLTADRPTYVACCMRPGRTHVLASSGLRQLAAAAVHAAPPPVLAACQLLASPALHVKHASNLGGWSTSNRHQMLEG